MTQKDQTITQDTNKANPENTHDARRALNLRQHPTVGNLVKSGSNVQENDIIKNWLYSLAILHHGHWDAARYYEKVNMGLGLTIAITAAISGTTAFAQLQQQTGQGGFSPWVQFLVGVFTLVAASLGAAQAFIRQSEVSARHKQAGQKYGTLRREFELKFYLGSQVNPKILEQLLTDFRIRWDAVDDETLPVPQRIYDRTKTEYKKSGLIYESKHSKEYSHRTSISTANNKNKNKTTNTRN